MLFGDGAISETPISALADESVFTLPVSVIKDIPVETSPFYSIEPKKLVWTIGCEDPNLWSFSKESACSITS